MATTGEKTLTLEAFLAIPETKPASEYIEGRVVQKVSPKSKHGLIQLRLGSVLNDVLTPSLCTFSELRCTFSGRSLVPDLVVFRLDRLARDPSGEVADDVFDPPDLAVEIVSPEQSVVHLVEKLAFCIENGVQLGWLIDPGKKKVMVFRPEQLPEELAPDGVLQDPEVLPGFRLTVAEMFGWLKLPEVES